MNTLKPVDHIDHYAEERQHVENETNSFDNMRSSLRQDIENPVQGPQTSDKSGSTTPVVSGSPLPTEDIANAMFPKEEKEDGKRGFFGAMAAPFMALGDAAAAPIANQNYRNKDFLGDTLYAIEVSGGAFIDSMFPGARDPESAFGDEAKNYGAMIVDQNLSELPAKLKPTVAVAISMLTDPSVTLGIGAAKLFQAGLKAKKLQAMGGEVAETGVWEEGVQKLLGLDSGFDAQELTKIGQLAKKADTGDKEALNALLKNMEEAPGIEVGTKVDMSQQMELINDYQKVFMGGGDTHIAFNADALQGERIAASLNKNVPLKAGNISLGKFNTEDDIKQFMEMTAKAFGDQYDKLIGPKTTHGYIKGVKESADIAHQRNLWTDLTGRHTGVMDPRQIYIDRQRLMATADMAEFYLKRAGRPNATRLEKVAAERAMYIHASTDSQISQITSQWGKVGHAFKVDVDRPSMSVYKQIDSLIDGGLNDEKLIDLMGQFMKDELSPGQKIQMLSSVPRGWKKMGFDGAYEAFTNSILSGPITHATNIVSNTAMLFWRPTEKYLRSLSAKAFMHHDEAGSQFAQANAQVAGIVGGAADVFRMASTDFFNVFREIQGTPAMKKMAYPEGLQVRNEIARQQIKPTITSENLWRRGGKIGQFVDYAGSLIRMPGNALLKEDKAFKLINYRMTVNQEAAKAAHAMGKSNADTMQIYRTLRNNPDETITKKAIDISDLYTFTNKLGEEGEKWAKWSQTTGMRWLIPFFRTPTNIVKFGIRNGVFGNVFRDLRHIAKSGPVGDVARAKMAMGTMAPLSLMLFLGDRVTGRVDSRTPTGRFRAQEGHPEYSIKVGDEWVSYEKLEPMRSILGFVINARDAMHGIDHTEPMSQEKVEELTMAVVAPFLQTIGDNYFFETFGFMHNVLKQGQDNDQDGMNTTIKRWLEKTAAATIVPSFFSQTNNAEFEQYYRIADGYVDQMKKRMWGFSDDLPIYPNAWGEPVELPDGIGIDMVSPFLTRRAKDSKIVEHMIDLKVSMPGLPRKFNFTVAKGEMEIELTSKQRSEFGILAGKGVPDAGAHSVPIKEIVRSLVNDPHFRALEPDLQKQHIESVFTQRRTVVKNYMMSINPEISAKVKEMTYNREILLRQQQARLDTLNRR